MYRRSNVDVSIHAPAWGATDAKTLFVTDPSGFNPRTRVGCDAMTRSLSSRLALFQSTHPRGVRRDDQIAFQQVGLVSIHAPAWGATDMLFWWDAEQRVSIHAPAWGATKARPLFAIVIAGFNPRTRVGCDRPCGGRSSARRRFQSTHPRGVRRDMARQPGDWLTVSIHAPAWGATLPPTTANRISRFQSTHPRGVRRPGAGNAGAAHEFQSTHPRGVRLFPCFIQ